jgi:hypothetical protein
VLTPNGLRIAVLPALNSPAPENTVYTLEIQTFGKTKTSYWIQSSGDWGVGYMSRWKDGEEGKKIDRQSYPNLCFFENGALEWKLPPDLFESFKIIRILIHTSALKPDGTAEYKNDTSPRIVLDGSEVTGYEGAAVDGDLEDIRSLPGSRSESDPENDGKGYAYPDIREIVLAPGRKHLYLGVKLKEKYPELDRTTFTLHFQYNGENFWLQGSDLYGFTYFGQFQDGQSSKPFKPSDRDQFIVISTSGSIEWKIPRSLLDDPGTVTLRIYLNGRDENGSDLWQSEQTRRLEIPLEISTLQ